MRIALVGTRGVPARYGGFETALEQVGLRLVERGHEVTVYCRPTGEIDRPSFLGMDLVHLPAVHRKSLETLSHTALSAAHLRMHRRHDVVILFNAANSPLVPLLRARHTPVATHVDGLEWQRAKWGRAGRRYYRFAEGLAVKWSDALIADARGIADYYRDEFRARTEQIAYGAPILVDVPDDGLLPLGLRRGEYHLVVARFEPENHVDTAIEGYLNSDALHPLVVVGSAPYADAHTHRIRALAARDPNVRLIGPVWDGALLDQLYANALTYVHGHSVGGTNPSLLRAMGAAAPSLAYDVTFNREVLGEDGSFFDDAASLARLLDFSEADPDAAAERGRALQRRAADRYSWDDVTDRYERMCMRLAAGSRQPERRSRPSGRRRPSRSAAPATILPGVHAAGKVPEQSNPLGVPRGSSHLGGAGELSPFPSGGDGDRGGRDAGES